MMATTFTLKLQKTYIYQGLQQLSIKYNLF